MLIQYYIKLIFIIFFLLPLEIFSQEVLLEEDVEGDSLVTKFGPNYKNYRHFYLATGIFYDKVNPGSEIILGKSWETIFGYRYKRKLANFYAIGLDVNISNNSYFLKQKANKIVPNDSIHDSEKIALNSLGGEFYNRINVGKRGNVIGKFIDFGFYANFLYKDKHVIKSKLTASNLFKAGKEKSIFTQLNYINKFNYGISLRAGFNKYVLYSKIRLSEIFKSNYNFPDLPKYSIGIQIGLH